MHYFPVTILDNFFDNPNDVREFALKQKYEPDIESEWPGVRTSEIYELNKDLWTQFTRRTFSLFYNFDKEDVQWSVKSSFQKISARYSGGWVHTDRPEILTGIVYLNPNTKADAGTSIFYRKKEYPFSSIINLDKKKAFYRNEMSHEDVEKYRLENNNQFEEVIRISNSYNRLVLFDSHLLHSANGYFGENDQEDRLALVFFVVKLSSESYPVARTKYY
jgi:hypothetical protein